MLTEPLKKKTAVNSTHSTNNKQNTVFANLEKSHPLNRNINETSSSAMSTDLNPMVFVGKLIRQKSELGSPEGPSSILQLHKDLLHGSSASLPRSSTKVWLLRKGAMQQEKAFQTEAFCKTIFPTVTRNQDDFYAKAK